MYGYSHTKMETYTKIREKPKMYGYSHTNQLDKLSTREPQYLYAGPNALIPDCGWVMDYIFSDDVLSQKIILHALIRARSAMVKRMQ